MAIKTISTLKEDIETNINVNTTGQISAIDIRDSIIDSIDSIINVSVEKSLYGANTILQSTADDTPIALTIPEQTVVGRITAGNITALTASQIRTLINVADGATPDQNIFSTFAVSGQSNVVPDSNSDTLTLVGSGNITITTNATTDTITISSTGDLVASNNLSDLTNADTARTNLGLAIGTNVQAYSAVLAGTTASFTTALNTKLGIVPTSDITGITGADVITNIVSLTQAEYDAIAKNASTLYIIVG